MLVLCSIAMTTNPATRLFGPFPLTLERIDHNLQAASPGVFALGEERHGLFLIKHIGRSDGDLRSTLKAQAGGRYSLFKFRYALSALDAFGKECELYHSVVTLHDPIHPVPPPGTNAACSGCRQHSHAASA